MFIGIILISTIIVGFLTTSLWLKENYDRKHPSPNGSELDEQNTESTNSCSHCGIRDIADCSHA